MNAGSPYGVQYLSFDPNGVATVTDAAHAEFTVSSDGATETTITAPGGIERIGKWIDAVKASDWNPADATTSLDATQTACSGPNTYLIKLSDGRLLKWGLSAMNSGSNALALACVWTDAQGPYMVTAPSGAFPY